MDLDNEPSDGHEESAKGKDESEPAVGTVISLTDLIDQMDRAAFRRSLASRDPAKILNVSSLDQLNRGPAKS
jgi:hypothetical protein